MVLSLIGLIAGLTSTSASAAGGPHYGTVNGTVTTVGGQPINGICPHLFDTGYANDLVGFAASGTTGTDGFYTQGTVPAGDYIVLFENCGANTAPTRTPDPNYTNIFHGNTYNPAKATVIRVRKNQTTTLGPDPIPLGGTVSGTATDATKGGPAWPIAIAVDIPGAKNFNIDSTHGFLIVCANTDGTYGVSGVPTGGVKMIFAPNNWACPDNNGHFNFGFWTQTKVKGVNTSPDGTLSNVNASVPESGHAAAQRSAGTRVGASPRPVHR